jgi:hypothetical protein
MAGSPVFIGADDVTSRTELRVRQRDTRLTFYREEAMDTVWAIESPVTMVEGESRTFTVQFLGASSVSSPSVKAYHNKSDVTSTLFPTNTPTASGDTVTLSPLEGIEGGETYVIVVTATVDSNTEIGKFQIVAVEPYEEQ